ncbi:MAG: hypothetical protein ABF245_10750, partial [Planktotalea arctica]
LTTAHAAISTVRVARGVDEKMEKRETPAALLYDLTIFSKLVFIRTPCCTVYPKLRLPEQRRKAIWKQNGSTLPSAMRTIQISIKFSPQFSARSREIYR